MRKGRADFVKILITGSKGQLGGELSDILRTGRADLGAADAAYRNARVTAADVEELDITDRAAVRAFAGELRPDLIVNCAAMTDVDGCETAPAAALRINALGPRNLASAAESCGAKFVQVSTDYVFDGSGGTPRREWDACAPNTVYGKSKLLGERYAAESCRRCFVVRTAWLYGLSGKNFVKTMRRLGASSRSVTVVADQRGNPTNANDLAFHILKLALTEEYGIYHCTGGGECSWYEFAGRIMELSGLPCKVLPCTSAEYAAAHPGTAPRPAYSSLDNLMLRATVGDGMRDWDGALQGFILKLNERERNV